MLIRRGGGAGTNPFQIFENGTSNGGGVVLLGNNNAAGLTPRASPGLNVGQRTLFLVPIGDSFESNSCSIPYTVTHPTVVDMLNVYTGILYPYSDPWLGPSTGPGSYLGQLADAIITSGKFARVIVGGGCAMGGATSYDWGPGGFAHRINAMCLYARQKGYPLSAPGDGGNWQMAVPMMCGTNDNAQHYTALQYTTNTNNCIAFLRALGCNSKIFIPQYKTLLAGVVSGGLQTAQAAMVDNSRGIYAWSNYDQYTGTTYRTADGTHPTPTMTAAISSDGSAVIGANY